MVKLLGGKPRARFLDADIRFNADASDGMTEWKWIKNSGARACRARPV